MKLTLDGRQTVIVALVGSHNYNLATENSDKDYKYFVAPTFDDLYNGVMFSGAKQSDELDYSAHDVRQLANLLWKANINFIEVLFSQELQFDTKLSFIFENKLALSSMNLPVFAAATLGMHRMKMANLFKGTDKTKKLIAKFGYDTKEACHALRCLLTLKRIAGGMNFGEAIFFDDSTISHSLLLDVKKGFYSLQEFYSGVGSLSSDLESVMNWFKVQKPNNELKAELDAVVKNYIRERMSDETQVL